MSSYDDDTSQLHSSERVVKRIVPSAYSFRSVLGNIAVAGRYVWSDTTKSKKNFIVGLVAVFLVVMSVSYAIHFVASTNLRLLQLTASKSPIIFLRLAEDNIGELDLVCCNSVLFD